MSSVRISLFQIQHVEVKIPDTEEHSYDECVSGS